MVREKLRDSSLLTMQSSWEEAHACFVENFSKLSFPEDLAKLLSFMTSDLVKKKFREEWKYETNLKVWPGRKVDSAYPETVVQTFVKLSDEAEFYLGGWLDSKNFREMSVEEIGEIKSQADEVLQIARRFMHF